MKLFCSKCQELYDYNVPGGNYIDGAFFGTTFPHLFFQTYRGTVMHACAPGSSWSRLCSLKTARAGEVFKEVLEIGNLEMAKT